MIINNNNYSKPFTFKKKIQKYIKHRFQSTNLKESNKQIQFKKNKKINAKDSYRIVKKMFSKAEFIVSVSPT